MIFVLMFSFFGCGGVQSKHDAIYWEEFSDNERVDIVESGRAYAEAIDYFQWRLVVSDDARTKSLLDTLSSLAGRDKDIRAFYFHLFNQICKNSDGALSEILGSYCQSVILSNPSYAFEYFIKKRDIMVDYASFLGYEMYFKREGTSTLPYDYEEFKSILHAEVGAEKKYKEVVSNFFVEIDNAMKRMD